LSDENAIGAREGYDLWAPAYDGFDNPMIALASRAIDKAGLAVAGKRFLDIGCGTGRNLVWAAAKGAAHLTGIDGSPGMLAQAREKLGPNATLIERDLAADWRIAPASHDVACIALVLEHFADVAPILAQAAAALAPGGALFVAEMHPDLARGGTGAHFEKDGKRHALPSYGHDRAEFETALRAAGFVDAAFVDWRADDHVAAIPKLAKHAGKSALISFTAKRA
jgi:SAM-dependent methyltransferase